MADLHDNATFVARRDDRCCHRWRCPGCAGRGLRRRGSRHLDCEASQDAADGRWSLALHFRKRPDEAAVRALIAAVAERCRKSRRCARARSRSHIRGARAHGLGAQEPRGPHSGGGRPVRRAWRALPRPVSGKPDQHRNRCGPRIRHRASRQHARMPARRSDADREGGPRSGFLALSA